MTILQSLRQSCPVTLFTYFCAVQIGQIMLSMPNAYAKMGLVAGLVLSVASGLISAYTIVLLVHLYEERKRRLVCLLCTLLNLWFVQSPICEFEAVQHTSWHVHVEERQEDIHRKHG